MAETDNVLVGRIRIAIGLVLIDQDRIPQATTKAEAYFDGQKHGDHDSR
jgi:hypothetical protein